MYSNVAQYPINRDFRINLPASGNEDIKTQSPAYVTYLQMLLKINKRELDIKYLASKIEQQISQFSFNYVAKYKNVCYPYYF